jgi:hypothetical protein
MAGLAITTPRDGDETVSRIAAIYDAEMAACGASLSWALLMTAERLALIAVYYAGRRDGRR